MKRSPQDVTQLLVEWSNGNQAALANLMPLIYDELRRLANRCLRRQRPGNTLQTTDLVHEVYLRLVNQDDARWQDRAHFFGIAAHLMRCILVDYVRSHHAAKRGGGMPKVSVDDVAGLSDERAVSLLMLDEALTSLESLDPQQSRIVELRAFGGLTVEETAEVLRVSTARVKREWSMAKAWLHRELHKGGEGRRL